MSTGALPQFAVHNIWGLWPRESGWPRQCETKNGPRDMRPQTGAAGAGVSERLSLLPWWILLVCNCKAVE